MPPAISQLPHKEQTLFRSALKLFEVRQFKKGLKTCDQILKKCPEHGESLAVKGLFLFNLGRKEEGYAFVHKGLDVDPNSSISWHVFGLVCRADGDYPEAIKCYQNALKSDSENIQILRDLAQMQTQTREYEHLVETRIKLVKLNASYAPYWIGLALAHHLNGRYDSAIKVLSAHEEKLKTDPTMGKFEISELLMYKNWLFELSGDHQGALENLKEIRTRITDVTAWKEQKANLLLKVGRKEDSASAYQELIERNPDSKEYIRGYLACNNLDLLRADDKQSIMEVVSGLQEQFPKSNVLKFIPLTICSGAEFVKAADELAKYSLRKGVPSLFTSLKTLYSDDESKGEALGKLFEKYSTQLESTKRLDDSTEDEPPMVKIWCDFYLAQHIDHYGDHERALALIDKTIALAPDTVELYMVKAKMLKHCGDLQGARDTMDLGRQRDLQDRFVNSKTVKYMLRNNEVDEAEKTMVMFVRDDAPHKIQEIVDMQATWYLSERAHAFRRIGDLGRALKNYYMVQKSFDDYYRDQFDFHSYCLRKLTMRAYVDILQWEDSVFAHPNYVSSAHGAISSLVDLHDRKQADEPFGPIVTEDENKRVTRNGSAKHGSHHLSGGIDSKQAEVDKDPSGSEYVNKEKHLDEALKFVETLEKFVPDKPETHTSAFEVHLRMHKYFLVLKALNALRAIDSKHPALAPSAVRLNAALDADTEFAAPMKAALKAQMAKTFGDLANKIDPKAKVPSIEQLIENAKGLISIDPKGNAEAVREMLMRAVSEEFAEDAKRTIESLVACKEMLISSACADENTIEAFGRAAKELYPLSTCF